MKNNYKRIEIKNSLYELIKEYAEKENMTIPDFIQYCFYFYLKYNPIEKEIKIIKEIEKIVNKNEII